MISWSNCVLRMLIRVFLRLTMLSCKSVMSSLSQRMISLRTTSRRTAILSWNSSKLSASSARSRENFEASSATSMSSLSEMNWWFDGSRVLSFFPRMQHRCLADDWIPSERCNNFSRRLGCSNKSFIVSELISRTWYNGISVFWQIIVMCYSYIYIWWQA